MQQMMQMMGQVFTAPFTIMADTFSRSMRGFQDLSRGTSSWMGGCEKRDDCSSRCDDDRWDGGDRDRWDCDRDDSWRDRDRCTDSWRSSDSDRSCDRCGSSRCTCGDRSDDRSCDRCGNSRCTCDGWRGDEDRCYRRSGRGYDRDSNRVRLVEFSLVSVARGNRRDPFYGQEVLRDGESKEEFKYRVITQYAKEHFPNDEDRRHLRVFARVLDSWCKETWDYEERKLDALRGIRDELETLRQKKS